jgi:hypothetical protein
MSLSRGKLPMLAAKGSKKIRLEDLHPEGARSSQGQLRDLRALIITLRQPRVAKSPNGSYKACSLDKL